jgi:hypothetical protein
MYALGSAGFLLSVIDHTKKIAAVN